MTRRALLSALAAVPLLRFLEPLARWIAPAPVFTTPWIPLAHTGKVRVVSVEPNAFFDPGIGDWTGVIFYDGEFRPLGYGPLGLDSEPPPWARR
jgi:hypothetical protein